MQIPEGRAVNNALSNLVRQTKQVLRATNQRAGHFLAKGDYPRAEALVAAAKAVGGFLDEAAALRSKWRTIRKASSPSGNEEKTPLWGFYQPVLKALVSRGGEGTQPEIEPVVEKLLADRMKPSDNRLDRRGVPRWKIMVRRTRKHLVREGLIEVASGGRWRVTAQGKHAAEDAAWKPIET